MGSVTTLEQLKYLKTKVALCHGVFDVLHEGHLSYLEEAKKLSDTVVVSITSDKYVNKGPGRPYFNEQIRARMVAALQCVDFVVINDEPRATNVITKLKPSYYVKGQDYKDPSKDVTGGIIEEEAACKEVGAKIHFTNRPTFSSSTLVNTFFQNFTEEQRETLDKIKEAGGIDYIESLFKEIAKLKVFVIGEPIVDTYIFCTPEGISSKSPTISARYQSEENYAGGSLAIANHLADFCHVELYAPHGKEMYFQQLKKDQVDKRVHYHECVFPYYTTPRKTRFIESDKNQRIFEITNIKENLSGHKDLYGMTEDQDLVLLCDFGHGLFENGFLQKIDTLKQFIALNCQTNSSNFGFNPFTKHKNYDYLSLDLREARVAFHDRYSDAQTLFRKIHPRPKVSMTLGGAGAIYSRGDGAIKCPAFSDKVVDATGAGDAYYAITSALVKVGANPQVVPFIGNVFAALKTKIIGNKFSVTKAELFKALTALLK